MAEIPFYSPSPNPLPSREREFFDFLRNRQYSMSKTFEILNFGQCDLPFDSFDLEALDRLAQGGKSFDFTQDREFVERPVDRLVELFLI
jgi:hypothetical protein